MPSLWGCDMGKEMSESLEDQAVCPSSSLSPPGTGQVFSLMFSHFLQDLDTYPRGSTWGCHRRTKE